MPKGGMIFFSYRFSRALRATHIVLSNRIEGWWKSERVRHSSALSKFSKSSLIEKASAFEFSVVALWASGGEDTHPVCFDGNISSNSTAKDTFKRLSLPYLVNIKLKGSTDAGRSGKNWVLRGSTRLTWCLAGFASSSPYRRLFLYHRRTAR